VHTIRSIKEENDDNTNTDNNNNHNGDNNDKTNYNNNYIPEKCYPYFFKISTD